MAIWVDADACPVKIKDLLYRVANRTKISKIIFLGNVMKKNGALYCFYLGSCRVSGSFKGIFDPRV